MDCKSFNVKLLSGADMPLLGFGTFRVNGQELILKVLDVALQAGYRSFDTAAVYGNEADIGLALKELLPKYNLKREDIFLTSKLSPSDHGGGEQTTLAVNKSLAKLGTSYLDLYLIHWPGVSGAPVGSASNRSKRTSSWHTLVDLHRKGLLRSIGVSNYTPRHIKELLLDCGGVKPSVNQVELHPHYRQQELLNLCKSEGILVQAYSSLGSTGSKSLLEDNTVNAIAKVLGHSSAQVLLRWALQQGIAIIPKAITPDHIISNMQLNFVIPDLEMNKLSNLHVNKKYAWDPNTVD